MKNVLIAVPIDPYMPEKLKTISLNKLVSLVEKIDFKAEIAVFDEPVDGEDTAERIAIVRNALLDEFLTPEFDYVLWIDADIIDYPQNLIQALYQVDPYAVVAPLVLIQNTRLFYDNLGFVENGTITESKPPYFLQKSRRVELDSVGCCYLIPADVFANGGRYAGVPVDRSKHHWSFWHTGHTEHWPVMQKAKEMGYPIICTRDVVVYHADLPSYGVVWHK